MSKREQKRLIGQAVTRRKQWRRLYPQWYIDLHFRLNDDEVGALLDYVEGIKNECPAQR
jgi:hypothetical protein